MLKREFLTLKSFMEGVKACEILNLAYRTARYDNDNEGKTHWIITITINE